MATVTGSKTADILVGTIDPITGLPADDSFQGLDGIDTVVLSSPLVLYSFAFDPASGAVVITGPEGVDRLYQIELLQTTVGIVPLGSLPVVIDPVPTGTPAPGPTIGNDYLVGTFQAEYMNGGYGNDLLAAGGGDDWFFGGPGDDTVLGQDGNDHLEGHAGNDALYGGDGNDALNGDLIGQSSDDLLSGGYGDDWLTAGDGADVLDGGAGRDFLFGEYGPDTLRGGDGDDILVGDFFASRYFQPVVYTMKPPNDDVLIGGGGNDYLQGGLGADVLVGGEGADRFVLAVASDSAPDAGDVILDFGGPVVAAKAAAGAAAYDTPGNERDVIDVSEIDAIAGTTINDGFTFIGAAGFSGAGQLHYVPAGAVTYIEGNVDADLAADFQITVQMANYSFTGFDFIL